mmetsp:Transcript_20392/g.42884  ORF Transcript_20392/g.42884 Transcript_20392/m.42884 type:complete len:86 (+) Transcript_20392:874-1131(+)
MERPMEVWEEAAVDTSELVFLRATRARVVKFLFFFGGGGWGAEGVVVGNGFRHDEDQFAFAVALFLLCRSDLNNPVSLAKQLHPL